MDVFGNTATNESYDGYPFYSHVLPIEKNFKIIPAVNWMNQNWHLSFYICAVYLAAVFGLQRFMRNRKPVDIRLPFMMWNVALSIFSTWGMFRFIPELLYILNNYGLEATVCNSNRNAVTHFWNFLFTFSKAVELVDTLFVVLRKRLSFLHVTHHVLALLVTWYFTKELPALTRWGITMNMVVHSVMYGYFALKGAKIRLPESVSIGITSLQIVQFIIGFFTSVVCLYFIYIGRECKTSYAAATGLLLTNGFLSYVFGKFFVKRYLSKSLKLD